jgi:ribosomal protein S27E
VNGRLFVASYEADCPSCGVGLVVPMRRLLPRETEKLADASGRTVVRRHQFESVDGGKYLDVICPGCSQASCQWLPAQKVGV